MRRADRRLVLTAAIVYFVQIPLLMAAYAVIGFDVLKAHWISDAPTLAWAILVLLWLVTVLGVSVALKQGRANLEDYRVARRAAVENGGVR